MRSPLAVALLAVAVFLAQPSLTRAAETGAVHPIDRFTAAELTTWAATYDTPLYLYDGDRIAANYRRIDAAFRAVYPKTRIHYALKANSNPAVVAILRAAGAGAEIVSEGELELARRAGFAGAEILFTSSSKSPSELTAALGAGAILNVDSEDELEQVARRARELGVTARISFRLNPAVDPHTHAKIATGVVDSKFGLHFSDGTALGAVKRALELAPHVKLVGLHSHIGSQITEPEPFRLAAEEMVEFVVRIHRDHGVRLEFVDLGGGLGIPYRDGQEVMSAEAWAKAQAEPLLAAKGALGGELPELWIEPGRALVADAGILLTRVNSVKTTPIKTFVNVDAGFNTLMRPVMYDAYHRVRAVGKSGSGPGKEVLVEIAGNVCETGDILASARELPPLAAGELVAILDAGAYGYSMASEYNSRPLPAELLVRGDRAELVRGRGTFDDLFRRTLIPPDLAPR